VANGGGQDFTSIQAAVDGFAPGAEGVIVVHEGFPYEDIVTVAEGRVLAIMAAPGEAPQWIGIDSVAPHLSITGGSTIVFLHEMSLTGNNGLAGAALDVDAGRAHVQRSAIVDNDGGAVAAHDGALIHLENTYVGGDAPDEVAIEVTTADASILYSTVL